MHETVAVEITPDAHPRKQDGDLAVKQLYAPIMDALKMRKREK